jgi:hypothetical protein
MTEKEEISEEHREILHQRFLQRHSEQQNVAEYRSFHIKKQQVASEDEKLLVNANENCRKMDK